MNHQGSIRFPFLGARENGEPFEYLLMDIDQEMANIAVFKWLVNHANLNPNEKIDLFIPNFLTLIYQFRKNTPGIVSIIEKNEKEDAYYYKIIFDKDMSLPPTVNNPEELAKSLPMESSLTDMSIKLIKDSLILKQGILVYLKHLAPYFSRIVDHSQQDYRFLENFIFTDIANRIKANEQELDILYQSLKVLKDPEDIPIKINLEYLRENIESEISLDLFLVTFSNATSRTEIMDLLRDSNPDKLNPRYLFLNYLISIKQLEKRLYSNYNQIVLIYLKSI